MRKLIALVTLLCVWTALTCGASAAGVTLRTFTPFADLDFAAQGYMDLITVWESETGNLVEDYSGSMDEDWMQEMRRKTASGEADILIIPIGSGLTDAQLVTAAELAQATPELGAKSSACMAEESGSILLTPVRLNWEALYINTDVLAAQGLAVPQTYAELISTCAALAQRGVTPIANALCEWSEIVLDCTALAGASEAQFGTQASLEGANEMLAALTAVGGFGADPWNVTDSDAEQQFIAGQAAMRFDSDWLAQSIPAERAEQVIVIGVPSKDGQARAKLAGTPSFGLAITRACWADDARCEAAMSLVGKLLSQEGMTILTSPTAGQLGASIAQLTMSTQDCAGILYDFMPETFDSWTESVIAGLMSF